MMSPDAWRALGETIISLAIVVAFVTVKLFAPTSDDVALWGALLGGISGYWFGRGAGNRTGGGPSGQ